MLGSGEVRPDLLNLHDYEAEAQRTLPKHIWDFIAGGAMDEVTLRRNRSALDAIAVRPRYLRDIRSRDLSTTVLGTQISMPVMVSPAGLHIAAHPEAELATAAGTGRSGTIFMVPTAADHSLENVATAAGGPLWFQLYHHARETTEDLVRRAQAAGYLALVLTVDTPIGAPKERDLRNEYLDVYRGPFAPDGMGRSNFLRFVEATSFESRGAGPLTWADLEWLRGLSSLPLVLKGITTAEDAVLAVEHGVDAVFVSNHGGRQFDMALSSIESLPEVVDAVRGRAEVYLDSGIRRGSDVVKALALGARAVGIGRPQFWGLAVGGADGVHAVLEILRAEVDRAFAYCGVTAVGELGPAAVRLPCA